MLDQREPGYSSAPTAIHFGGFDSRAHQLIRSYLHVYGARSIGPYSHCQSNSLMSIIAPCIVSLLHVHSAIDLEGMACDVFPVLKEVASTLSYFVGAAWPAERYFRQ